jgi:hypothetical protein
MLLICAELFCVLSCAKLDPATPLPRSDLMRQSAMATLKLFSPFLAACLLLPTGASCMERDWSVGVYAGQYYDSEPAGIIKGNGNFLSQYIVALTASKTLWRARDYPLALEVDAMVGHQFGIATLQEFAIAPVLRWSGFPWNDTLATSFRFGPVGYSYTTIVSPLEKNANGEGSRNLNFLMAEVTFSRPQSPSDEIFVRLHHRCTVFDLLNNYGANGQDFLALGFRRFF